MIIWTEQRPDFFRRSGEELFRVLPFPAVCELLLNRERSRFVVVNKSIIDSIWEHLAERPIEMGGLLVGYVYDLPNDRLAIAIIDHVRSAQYDSTGVSLRMEPEVWDRARSLARDGSSVIGWYHSHPNLGAFFSGTDRRTQRAFFNHPHSIGLVVDPWRGEEKWFVGADSDDIHQKQVLRWPANPK